MQRALSGSPLCRSTSLRGSTFGCFHDIVVHLKSCIPLQIQITSLSVCVSLSATVALGCFFAPKVYIVLFQPYKNVRNYRQKGAVSNLFSQQMNFIRCVRSAGGAAHSCSYIFFHAFTCTRIEPTLWNFPIFISIFSKLARTSFPTLNTQGELSTRLGSAWGIRRRQSAFRRSSLLWSVRGQRTRKRSNTVTSRSSKAIAPLLLAKLFMHFVLKQQGARAFALPIEEDSILHSFLHDVSFAQRVAVLGCVMCNQRCVQCSLLNNENVTIQPHFTPTPAPLTYE